MTGIKYLSLFSGIGGFELGIERAFSVWNGESTQGDGKGKTLKQGMEPASKGLCDKRSIASDMQPRNTRKVSCIGFSEIDKYAIQIYEKHFKGHKNYGDARGIDADRLPDFDMLCGGFPCQAFSIAGKRGGFDDTRGTLFHEIARIARAKRPKLLFLENVKGLLSHDQGRTFGTILETFSELGYILEWQVLNSKDYGVPQNRERVFIIGHLRDRCGQQVFPIGEGSREVKSMEIRVVENISNSNERNVVYDTKGSVGALNTAQGGGLTPLIPKDTRIRRLTPTECERLQGFPDGWTEGISDSQRYKCLGNAVTANVIQAIAERLFR